MASDTTAPPGRSQFPTILRDEIEAINKRRRRLRRKELALEVHAGHKAIDAVGLALSGGGVRSAAFSLGVLQALNHHNVLRNIDYISTVSGGGYIGSSLTAGMIKSEGTFPFGGAPSAGPDPTSAEIRDTEAVGHLRNYSNYLIPAGMRDLLTGIAIVIRGLIANFAWVLAVVLIFAAFMILSNPDRSDLSCPDLLGLPLCGLTSNFGLTLVLMVTGVVLFLLWALYRSLIASDHMAEFRTKLPMLAAWYLVLAAIVFFFELQTFLIRGMFDLKIETFDSLEWLTGTLTGVTAIITPLAALVTLFRQQIGDMQKASNANAKISTRAIAALGSIAFWVAGAAVPLLIWVAYLYLSYWGIINDRAEQPVRTEQTILANSVSKAGEEANPACWANCKPNNKDRKGVDPAEFCNTPLTFSENAPKEGEHTPIWLIKTATGLVRYALCPVFGPASLQSKAAAPLGNSSAPATDGPKDGMLIRIVNRPLVFLYFSLGVLLVILGMILKPNANSLHRLYRDRLSKAFLFDPNRPTLQAARKTDKSNSDQSREFLQLDRLRLSELSSEFAPYHLINTALNIQGSDYANRRGRNADFFLFSPRHVGSEATGYAKMADFEQHANDLDLATAMAISGAAASSNMGSSSITPLRPTLALLNIRLGYWLKNPCYNGLDEHKKRLRYKKMLRAATPFLFAEITGRLYEDSSDIYLTDGGHIENLGIYELLKRRCKLIVVVDAEADLAMHFPSFITLQRYARIDLGVLIEVPWCQIKKATCGWMGFPEREGVEDKSGPHAAIGSIDYGGGEQGLLLYIKSSLTGDENDYVRDYGRRYERFPHETTGDQFFSEEQFEVYRALGFHAAHGVLSYRDALEVTGTTRLVKLNDSQNEMMVMARAALCNGPDHGLPATKTDRGTSAAPLPALA